MERKTILLADDNEDDVLLMQKIFARLGLEKSLRIVRDGAEAIDYLSGAHKFADRKLYPWPSLLILDMSMPQKTGEEVMAWLKQTPHLHRLLVIMMTGATRSSSSDHIFERHGNIVFLNSEFLKPARLETVDTMVRLFESWLKTTPIAAPPEA
jgi:CheY-like chemotaxis protein